MKALIFVCLLFVGCSEDLPTGEQRDYGMRHESEESTPHTYYFNGGTLTSADSGIVFTFYDSILSHSEKTVLLKVNEDAPIMMAPGNTNFIFLFTGESMGLFK